MNILIMGPAGSGKGTMSAKIIAEYKVPHISTGDMFREAIKQDTELGRIAKQYIDDGKLVPDEITIAMIKDRLAQPDCKKGYLLDGYPRTLKQAYVFEEIAETIEKPVEVVLNLTVDFDELAKRVTGRRLCKNCGAIYHTTNFPPKVDGICDTCGTSLIQRSDDTVEQLRVRLDEHVKNTGPVLEHFQQMGVVKNINASQNVEDVWHDIREILESFK